MSQFYQDSIFWVDVDKIKPNPFQPRREFDPIQLKSLSDSIRQYGVLQALVVTRKEFVKEDGGMGVEYELIAGERRLRASKMAGLAQVPVLIKTGDESDMMKLELAIIENLQREDLNPVDRAIAFKRLIDEFGFKHITVAQKVGKSREYVTNTLRILQLPEEIINALKAGKIVEGHTRPLLMLTDRPEEQKTLFKQIVDSRISVREAENIARRIAIERARIKGDLLDVETRELEDKLTEKLGTRVLIEKKHQTTAGRIMISFANEDDLKHIFEMVSKGFNAISSKQENPNQEMVEKKDEVVLEGDSLNILDDRSLDEVKKSEEIEDDAELYSIKNFSI